MLIARLYSAWVIFSMAAFFFLFIIPQIACIPFKRAHVLVLRMNYLWAWGFFRLALIPVRQHWKFEPKKNQQYILCANHFSYLDIPALGLFPQPFKFVGKSQLQKIPLFGLMYKYIHITVNRSSYRSRAKSLEQTRQAINDGYSLGVFPEGGIRFSTLPSMVPFQDGAFRVAAECGIPIVPVTFLDNHYILPDDDRFLFQRKKCRIIYHEPIIPASNDEEGIRQLKTKVYRVIQDELNSQLITKEKSIRIDQS